MRSYLACGDQVKSGTHIVELSAARVRTYSCDSVCCSPLESDNLSMSLSYFNNSSLEQRRLSNNATWPSWASIKHPTITVTVALPQRASEADASANHTVCLWLELAAASKPRNQCKPGRVCMRDRQPECQSGFFGFCKSWTCVHIRPTTKRAILIQESLRHIMSHVRRKGSDRVNGNVDSRDSEDDEGKQENYITRGGVMRRTTRVWSWNVSD